MSANLIKVWDIPGGIHPNENKHQSLKTPIQLAPIPSELVFPLSQHIGAPAEPIVNIGQHVLKGQMIAKATGFISAPIHASTSGIVSAIENRPIPHSSGMNAPCIIMQSDGKDEWIEHQGIQNYQQVDKKTLVDYIRNAGIAGMGGAGFPSAVKLSIKEGQTIETLILNGTECEPYITADDILMQERANDIIEGARILQYLISPTVQTLIGIEDNKPEAIKALQKAAESTSIKIVVFPTKYPSGGEKQLIQILTGKQVPSGKLPGDIGIVCQNIGTAVAIYRAVVYGEPLISRITTVTGNAVDKQQNYEVLLGTPVQTLLSMSGYHPEKASRLIMGGPMMGFALASTDISIVKTTNCILAPTQQELPTPPPAQACIRCGMCAEACPVTLLPQQMLWFAQSKNHEGLKEHHLFDCIECGACSYVCPSTIPLVQYYRSAKSDIRKADSDLKKADYSKVRFEARLQRLERLEAEKEAKRLERQKAASATSPPENKIAPIANTTATTTTNTAPATNDAILDPVQAAIERVKRKAASAELTTNPAEINPAEIDPVQAAIERAQAKRAASNDNIDPKIKLQNDIAALQKRLSTANEKLQIADAENASTVDALKNSVSKLQEKIDSAQEQLNQLG